MNQLAIHLRVKRYCSGRHRRFRRRRRASEHRRVAVYRAESTWYTRELEPGIRFSRITHYDGCCVRFLPDDLVSQEKNRGE